MANSRTNYEIRPLPPEMTPATICKLLDKLKAAGMILVYPYEAPLVQSKLIKHQLGSLSWVK